MKHNEFEIGKSFWTGTGEWVCTDKGTRVIIAIEKSQLGVAFLKTPPYDVVETVFDENDLLGCHLTKEEP